MKKLLKVVLIVLAVISALLGLLMLFSDFGVSIAFFIICAVCVFAAAKVNKAFDAKNANQHVATSLEDIVAKYGTVGGDENMFPVAGVTFKNDDGKSRQKILKNLYEDDSFYSAEIEEYEYNGELALRVMVDDECVGNIRRTDIAKVSELLTTAKSISVEIDNFEDEDEDGKIIYRADVIIYA